MRDQELELVILPDLLRGRQSQYSEHDNYKWMVGPRADKMRAV